ncbi:TBC1 domain family member 2A isoform X3 [Takifugu rubripes]|uniref:TBC1 domain family member 2A isoform X3 n=1 Tax=Takifugu rubripes TaxID=31033 RepID=UPI00114573A1|nr:TBC1 domain family member 2A isoform X3 [Takifugu rubripes]
MFRCSREHVGTGSASAASSCRQQGESSSFLRGAASRVEWVKMFGSRSSTETQQGSTETQQGSTEIQQGSTETQQGSAEIQQGSTETQQGSTEIQQESTETQQGSTETQQGSTETQEGSSETQEGSSETQEGSSETQSPTGTKQDSTETQQGSTESQQGSTETHQGSTESQQGSTENQQGSTETQQGSTESQQGSTETQQGSTESQQGSTENQQCPTTTREGPAEGTDPSGAINSNQRLDSSAKPNCLKPPEKLFLSEQQEYFKDDQTKPEKYLAGPDQSGQDQLPAEKNWKDSPLTIQANIGESSVSKPHQEDPAGPFYTKHEQTCDEFQKYQRLDDLPSKKLRVNQPRWHSGDLDPIHLKNQQPTDQKNLSSVVSSEVRLPEAAFVAPLSEASAEEFAPAEAPSALGSTAEPKLCGFLLKQGGPLKAWKLRWFTYEEQKNQLFYYRTPQDVTPLGRIELSSATFTYPLKAETGTFHIKTPERTFVLKAVTQELMLYWLQQLQMKRWCHRRPAIGPHCPDSDPAANFLPLLKSPVGLVGEEAANVLSLRTPLANMSLKHPLIEIQNSVHSLRKRASREWSQSVFYVEAPMDPSNTTGLRTPPEPLKPPPTLLAEPPSQESPVETRESSSFFNSWNMKKTGGSSSQQDLSGDALSSQQVLSGDALSSQQVLSGDALSSQQVLSGDALSSQQVLGGDALSSQQVLSGDALSSQQVLSGDALSSQQVLGGDALSSQQVLSGDALSSQQVLSGDALSSQQVLSGDALSSQQVFSGDALSSQQMWRLQQDKQMLAEEVKAQKEMVWILHKALEASQLEKRSCAQFLAEKGEQERLEVLRHRERQAARLQEQLEEAKVEAESLRRRLAQRSTQVEELEEQIKILMEKNAAKQEVIINLSNQVTTWMVEQQLAASSNPSRQQTFKQLQQQMENLQDDIEAHKTQNKFLNSEIYQLTRLWRTSSEQERSLMMKTSYLEARICQTESSYLDVLRQLQDTKTLDAAQQEAVQKLVEDALKREMKSVARQQVTSDYDDYGFKIFSDYEVEDLKLLAKIQALEIRSHNLLQQEGVERPLLDRWAQYLTGRSDDHLTASQELKGLLRAGVPQEYRHRLWSWMVRVRTRSIREHDPECYQQLCAKSQTSPHPASRQIELDLPRTLTTNRLFCSPSSAALQQLRRILLAFSWRNPEIGYCQGLNRLAAVALLVLQSEEDAFWCLVAIVETIMPQDYYTKDLLASQADQRVLKDFLSEKLPRLSAHFESLSVDVSLITFNWFLVVFVESLPSDILLPLWDAFLYEGTKVIFRYVLALFKYREEDVLKIHDSVEIYQYLRIFTKTITDTRKLSNIAFSVMNPFPRRVLRSRRALHLEHLRAELQQLQRQQEALVKERAERKDKDLDTVASEDDGEL